jgi:hypothetical protein
MVKTEVTCDQCGKAIPPDANRLVVSWVDGVSSTRWTTSSAHHTVPFNWFMRPVDLCSKQCAKAWIGERTP